MSYLKKKIYCIVPTLNVTEKMLNAARLSINSNGNQRKNTAGDKTLFKFNKKNTKEFMTYRMYNEADIKIELAKAEWNR